ncbi:hypothetical protein [Streptosporangium sp. LJ11]|uniref:hypothetical protein n=1 Tax=Streptosporangium sp. LJ11 TaxID=3436927 RepID=UPI003F7ACF0A
MSPRKAAALRDGEGDRSLREHLIAAAERLMAQRGTAGLTVRDLGRLAPGANPEAAAAMIIGACHELVLPHLLGGGAATALEIPPGFVEDLLTTVLNGIGPAGSPGNIAGAGRPASPT